MKTLSKVALPRTDRTVMLPRKGSNEVDVSRASCDRRRGYYHESTAPTSPDMTERHDTISHGLSKPDIQSIPYRDFSGVVLRHGVTTGILK